GHERLHESLKDLAPQTTTREVGYALVGRRVVLCYSERPARYQRLNEQPQLTERRQQRRAQERQHLARRHQIEALRDRNQASVVNNKRTATRFVGRNEFVFHPQPVAQLERGWRRGEKIIRGAINEKTITFDSFEYAAEAASRFEQRKLRLRQ